MIRRSSLDPRGRHASATEGTERPATARIGPFLIRSGPSHARLRYLRCRPPQRARSYNRTAGSRWTRSSRRRRAPLRGEPRARCPPKSRSCRRPLSRRTAPRSRARERAASSRLERASLASSFHLSRRPVRPRKPVAGRSARTSSWRVMRDRKPARRDARRASRMAFMERQQATPPQRHLPLAPAPRPAQPP